MNTPTPDENEPAVDPIAESRGRVQFSLRWLLTLVLVVSLAMGAVAILVPALLELESLRSHGQERGC